MNNIIRRIFPQKALYCVNCKHYKFNPRPVHVCTKQPEERKQINLVTGEIIKSRYKSFNALIERDTGRCGPKAIFFEEKDHE